MLGTCDLLLLNQVIKNQRALKSPQKFRTLSSSSANFLGSWHISGLKSKSYYEIWTFWSKNRRWPNLKMILTSLLTFIGLCFYQSTVRLNFSKALNFSYAYMQIAGFLKLFKLDICTKEIRFSHFRFPQKCGSINTSHFSCMSVASGLCFDFSLLISTWLLHCRVLVAR